MIKGGKKSLKALHTSRLLPMASSVKLAYILTHKEAIVSLATSAKDSPELPLKLVMSMGGSGTAAQHGMQVADSQSKTRSAPGGCADRYRAVPTEQEHNQD